MNLRARCACSAALFIAISIQAQEVCDNGVDDDSDGLIDLLDTTDCACAPGGSSTLLMNPSFEDFSACPYNWSQMDLTTGWYQATFNTTDYFNQCGFFRDWITLPLPDGAGCVGGFQTQGYQEFPGTCLNYPLHPGGTDTLCFSISAYKAESFQLADTVPIDFGPVGITIWGVPFCINWPLETEWCPEYMNWIPIGTAIYDPSSAWQTLCIPCSPPVDIQAIIIGPACDLPESYGQLGQGPYIPYFIYDAFTHVQASAITPNGSWCNADLGLTAQAPGNTVGSQWYYEGVAIPGATGTELPLSTLGLDAGTYQFQAVSDSGCSIASFIVEPPVYPEVPVIDWAQDLFIAVNDPQLAYQWFLDGEAIAGATGNTYVPVVNGSYTLQVTTADGCSSLSDAYVVLSTGLGDAGQQTAVMYDPGTRTLHIRFPGQAWRSELRDAAGRLIRSSTDSGSTTWGMADLPGGIYLVRINDRVFRIAVQR